MPSSYTPNYQLNQWEADDQVQRIDFNADNAKIDAAMGAFAQALAGKADRADCFRIITGSYTGTGTQVAAHYSIGTRPKLLILVTDNTSQNSTYDRFMIAVEDLELRFNSGGANFPSFAHIIRFDDDGFIVDHSQRDIKLGFNREGAKQFYWVLC